MMGNRIVNASELKGRQLKRAYEAYIDSSASTDRLEKTAAKKLHAAPGAISCLMASTVLGIFCIPCVYPALREMRDASIQDELSGIKVEVDERGRFQDLLN